MLGEERGRRTDPSFNCKSYLNVVRDKKGTKEIQDPAPDFVYSRHSISVDKE